MNKIRPLKASLEYEARLSAAVDDLAIKQSQIARAMSHIASLNSIAGERKEELKRMKDETESLRISIDNLKMRREAVKEVQKASLRGDETRAKELRNSIRLLTSLNKRIVRETSILQKKQGTLRALRKSNLQAKRDLALAVQHVKTAARMESMIRSRAEKRDKITADREKKWVHNDKVLKERIRVFLETKKKFQFYANRLKRMFIEKGVPLPDKVADLLNNL